jgi:lysozyme family protein
VENLTLKEAGEIYRARYWNPMRLDEVGHIKAQLLLFDQAVNRGVFSATKQAQRVINAIYEEPKVIVDGMLGKKTLDAINGIHTPLFCREYIQASQHFYINICVNRPNQIVFLKGWINRTHALMDALWDDQGPKQHLCNPKAYDDHL